MMRSWGRFERLFVLGAAVVIAGIVVANVRFAMHQYAHASHDAVMRGARAAIDHWGAAFKRVAPPNPHTLTLKRHAIRFVTIHRTVYRYRLEAPGLLVRIKGRGKPRVVARDVTDVRFLYLRSDGKTPARNAFQVHYVMMTLTVSHGSVTKTYHLTVAPRAFT